MCGFPSPRHMHIPYSAKHWRIWRLSIINSIKFSHPSIVNTLKCNGKPTQFAKVLPSTELHEYRVISPKFHPARHFTLYGTHVHLFLYYSDRLKCPHIVMALTLNLMQGYYNFRLSGYKSYRCMEKNYM